MRYTAICTHTTQRLGLRVHTGKASLEREASQPQYLLKGIRGRELQKGERYSTQWLLEIFPSIPSANN